MKSFAPGDRVFVRAVLGFGRDKAGTVETDMGDAVLVRVDGKAKPVPFKRDRVRIQVDLRVIEGGPYRSPEKPRPVAPPAPLEAHINAPLKWPPPHARGPKPIPQPKPGRIVSSAAEEITASDPVRAGQDVEPECTQVEPERYGPHQESATPRGGSQVRPHEPLPSRPSTQQSRVLGQDEHDAVILPPRRRVQLRAVPKPAQPDRDATYLRFVREHACIGCTRTIDVDAHHWARRGQKGMGTKPSDYQTVPLCTDCHTRFHDSAELPAMNGSASKVWILAKQVDLLVAWVRLLTAKLAERRSVR